MAVLISTGQYSTPSLIEKLRHFEQRTKGTVRRRKDRKENTYKLRKTKNIRTTENISTTKKHKEDRIWEKQKYRKSKSTTVTTKEQRQRIKQHQRTRRDQRL